MAWLKKVLSHLSEARGSSFMKLNVDVVEITQEYKTDGFGSSCLLHTSIFEI